MAAMAFLGCAGFPDAAAANPPRSNDSADDVVFYAGGAGNQRFYAVVQLSDGTVLVGGTADHLEWLPTTAKRITLDGSALQSKPTGKVPLILRLSPDLQTVMQILSLPKDSAVDIRFIKSTHVPGEKTGALYVSGQRLGNKGVRSIY